MLNSGKLAGKAAFITGASRGIGKAIALKATKDGAKVVAATKTCDPCTDSPRTIFTAAQEGTVEFMRGKMQTRGFHSLSERTSFGHVVRNDVPSMFCSANIYTTSTNFNDYSDVPQVFDRIKSVASAKIVEQVKAIYLFDVDQRGKYFIDFKNGEGEVGQGDPQHKPDVTISMNEEVFLKIFNRELAPATAFMTGKIKISGDLTKALTLEKVMVAAREARDKAKN